jgi:hypothetical protein
VSEQLVVGTDVELPRSLVLHTLEQGSWPWTFDYLLKAVARQRTLPLDPVLLFWPLRPDVDAPALADADTEALADGLLQPDRYELRLLSRREGEHVVKLWPDSRDFFTRESQTPEEPLKPMAKPVPRERRSPFDPIG